MDINELRKRLQENRNMPWIVARMMESIPAVKEAGISELAGIMASSDFSVHYNDVDGLIDMLEAHLAENGGGE